MKLKKRLKELPRNKFLMLALIFIVVSLVMVFAGNVVFQDGNLNVAGRLGIVTTTPEDLLHVDGTVSSTGSPILVDVDFAGPTGGLAIRNIDLTDGAGAQINFRDSSNNDRARMGALFTDQTADDSALFFITSNAGVREEQVRISKEGNVGIGTSTPGEMLSLLPTRSVAFSAGDHTTWADIFVRNNINLDGAAAGIGFIIKTGDHANAAAGIAAVRDDPIDRGAGLVFITRPASAASVERMRISKEGNLGIGTSNPIDLLHLSSTAPAFRMEDTSPSAEDLFMTVDGNFLEMRRVGGSTGEGLYLDLVNSMLGIGTQTPQRSLHIVDVLRLEPRITAPASAALGDIYVDSDTNELCFYDGNSWVGLRAGGTCA